MDLVEEQLRNTKTIAVVGLSDNPDRDSHRVSKYMQSQGYRIIPVNPMVDEVRAGRPRLFTGWSEENWDGHYSEFGVGGALTFEGGVQAAETINRKRETLQQLSVVLDTELGEVAAQLIATLHTMIEVPPKLGSTPRTQTPE